MEVLHPLKDNSRLVAEISKQPDEVELIPVKVFLPDYLDTTSMVALKRRMVEAANVTGRKLRLLASTHNIEVEKWATRLFADRDDIYLTVDWR